MLSQSAEYALRAAVVLARAHPLPQTNQQLAELTRVPPGYLPKVMHDLAKAGLVHAQRGRKGGLRLARPADSITLLEVVNAQGAIHRILECPLGLSSHAGRLCALHRKLDGIIACVERALRETTLADMLHATDGMVPLCDRSAAELPVVRLQGIDPRH
jgi:Rrf2 family protein